MGVADHKLRTHEAERVQTRTNRCKLQMVYICEPEMVMAEAAKLPAAAGLVVGMTGAVGCIYWHGNAGRSQVRAGTTKDGHPTPPGILNHLAR